MYDRHFREPDRYPGAVGFYADLFTEGRLLQRFEPSNIRGGPVIRIYGIEDP